MITDNPVFLDPKTWALVGAALFIGGLTKGTLGIGMPALAVPLMLSAVSLPTAIALLVAPSYLSNVIELSNIPDKKAVLKRFSWLIAGLCAGAVIGAMVVLSISRGWAVFLMGVTAILFALGQAARLDITVPIKAERPAGAAVGVVSGIFGGFTGLFGPPIAAYLLALRMRHEEFVGAIALIYLFGLSVLYLLLARSGVLNSDVLLVSSLGCIMVYAGLIAGRWLRRRIEEPILRFATTGFLGLVGVDLCLRGFGIRWFEVFS